MTAEERAKDFIENEKQFHLGFLPTEQSHPDSVTLEDDFRKDSISGVKTLQKIDRNVLAMAKRVLASSLFDDLKNTMVRTLKNGGRIAFSGCGATGRLSILLESMWRTACRDTGLLKEYSDRVFSIMTGGDFALVKSVEFFEDYACFGRRQVQELDFTANDLLVAITEGGETSSVLGTVDEAVSRGARVFLLFNNPADLLASRLERSAKAIRDPRVTVIDLFCGPMALAGSTRMQATTSEQLVAGGALEAAFCELANLPKRDYSADFESLLDQLESEPVRAAIAAYVDFEESVYAKHGKITYFTHDYLLDVFTDTTERSPTFMLPPFRAVGDTVSAQSWAFVKDPFFNTEDAWLRAMDRPLRCLNWNMVDYREMGVADRIKTPPAISSSDLLAFRIGNEAAPERRENASDAAVIFSFGDEADSPEFKRACAESVHGFPLVRMLSVASAHGDFSMPGIQRTEDRKTAPLLLMDHLAVKLVLNTISTGVMTKNGRVSGNWMSYVALSNKKLIDRGIRLVSELGKISYEDAAKRIFDAIEATGSVRSAGGERICAVQYALKQLGR